MRRVTWCLTTLFPTFLLTDIPIRWVSVSVFLTYMTNWRLAWDFADLYMVWKSEFFLMLGNLFILVFCPFFRGEIFWGSLGRGNEGWDWGVLVCYDRWRFAYLTPDGAREVCAVFDPAVHLHCASLHVGHGLRPMKKCKQKSAYVQAQRKFLLAFFRTAHCLREKKGHNLL